MALPQKKFSELTPVTALNDVDTFPVVQSGEVKSASKLLISNTMFGEIDGLTSQDVLEDTNLFVIRDGVDSKKVSPEVMQQYMAKTFMNQGQYTNLVITRPSNSTVRIVADSIFVGLHEHINVDLTLDIAVSGALGLDTGTEGASTLYYIWLMEKLDGTLTGVFSASFTSPTPPADYVNFRRISFVKNVSSNFLLFEQIDDQYYCEHTSFELLSGGAATTRTEIPLTILPNYKLIKDMSLITTVGGTTTCSIATNASDNMNLVQIRSSGSTTTVIAILVSPRAQSIWYNHASGGQTLTAGVSRMTLKV